MLISLQKNFSSRSFSINSLYLFTVSAVEAIFCLTYDNTLLYTYEGRKKN